jgi:hypothetical protein
MLHVARLIERRFPRRATAVLAVLLSCSALAVVSGVFALAKG